MIPEHPHPWQVRLFAIAAFIGVVGWSVIFGLLIWWTVQPANLPTVTEPIEVLNPGNAVAINDTLLMRLDVVKPHELAQVGTVRLLECLSGNLVTLTSTDIRLPAGTYSVISDSIIIPAKITPGDTCSAVFEITYRINPIREEVVRFDSEPFTVLPGTTPHLI